MKRRPFSSYLQAYGRLLPMCLCFTLSATLIVSNTLLMGEYKAQIRTYVLILLQIHSTRRPWKVMEGTHELKQPQFLISEPSAFGVMLTQMTGLRLTTMGIPPLLCCVFPYRWYQKTPGWFQPDQSVQTSLILDKQHIIPAVRFTAVGSELFEKRSCPEKYLHKWEWGAPHCSILPTLPWVWLCLIDPVLSVAFVLIWDQHRDKSWSQINDQDNKIQAPQQLLKPWKHCAL